MSGIIEGTAEEVGTDLEVTAPAPPPTSLFGTDNPAEVIVRASAVAASLKGVLTAQKMVTRIQGKEYVGVEGWQTLGSMLGVVPVVVWTRPVEGGWEARVEARTADGRVVGAAESMCVEEEGGNWGKKATSNARRSMAQTRAVSKALRGPLGFVVTLAGYQATPSEEMEHVAAPEPAPAPPSPPINVARAAQITATIAARMQDGSLDGERLKMIVLGSGAAPSKIDGYAITLLTKDQALFVEGELSKLGVTA